VQAENGVTKVMFDVYERFNKSRILVYVSNDSGIKENDFNYGLSTAKLTLRDIKKMDTNWYSTIVIESKKPIN